jgi:hypothetical protein
MNDGVKILLERMQTHPDEFFDESSRLHVTSKWGKLIADHQDFLEPEDKNALNDGLKKLHRQIFTEKVLEELVDPKKSSLEDVINQYRVKGMPSVGTTPALSSLTLETSEHIKAHIATLEKIKKEYEPKQHRTLFGKLFNYQ